MMLNNCYKIEILTGLNEDVVGGRYVGAAVDVRTGREVVVVWRVVVVLTVGSSHDELFAPFVHYVN